MIAFLEGVLEERQPTRVLLNVQGVGYEVLIPLSTYEGLPASGQSCRILIYDYLREEQHRLFGFLREKERELFEMLLGITGIGPKIALSALSGLPAQDIKAAVIGGDVKRLSSISGIGKKMAERLVTELRYKLDQGDALEVAAAAAGQSGGEPRFRDTVMALIALGYKQEDARKLAQDAFCHSGGEEGVEDLLKRALLKG